MIPVAVMAAQGVGQPVAAVADEACSPAMDEARFRLLYQRTARPLRAYLRRSCGDAALADDLLQEAYYRLLRSGFDRADELECRKYLFRIATNLIRDHYRSRRPESPELPEISTPGHQLEEVQLRGDVAGVLAAMSPRDRQLLWLAYVEGASHREIAEATGLKEASMRSMLFRARQRMAGLLRDRGLGPGDGGTP